MAHESGEMLGIAGVGAGATTDMDGKSMEAARPGGARTVATPAELGKEARFVIVAVGYDDEAAAVMLDTGGLLENMAPGRVIAVAATCTPDHVKILAARAAAKSVELLDAPICRGQRAADEGTMLSLCGGKPAIFGRALPVLKTDYAAAVPVTR